MITVDEAVEDLVRVQAEVIRLRDALEAISCPSQTSDLLWWQQAARDALNTPDREG